MVSIKDIATSLGVSRGTVDRALHNRSGVAPEVKKKILEKADELGYHSNKAARMLAIRKNPRVIGILMPSLSNPFFEDVKKGIYAAAEEYADSGFSVRIKEVEGFESSVHLLAIKELRDEADALLVVTLDDKRIINELEKGPQPFAMLNSLLSTDKALFYSGSDYRQKGRLNAGLLCMIGIAPFHILLIQGSMAMRGHAEACQSFISSLIEKGVDFNIVATCNSEDSDDRTFEEVSRELREHPEINTIFVVSAGVCGAVKACEGKDILIFASDDVPSVKDAIKREQVAWTVCQDPYMQGYQGYKKMCEYFLVPDRECASYIAKHVVKIKENIEE